MFEGLFENEENNFTSNVNFESNKNTCSGTKKSGSNCASNLEKPELLREYFVGLKNSRATCYMNSALQILYMNPLLRKIILEFNLYNQGLSNFSLISGHKHEIMSSLQELFSILMFSNKRSVTTTNLTKAFHWDNDDLKGQQDSQEFIRLFLFEVMENILYNTPYEALLKKMFKINFNSYFKCLNCHAVKNREEDSYDIIISLENHHDLRDTLTSMYNSAEHIDGYKCDMCNSSVTIEKGLKIKSLPMFLFLNLSRIKYDFFTDQSVKITSALQFPLELNMQAYIDHDLFFHENRDKDEVRYFYCRIIIQM